MILEIPGYCLPDPYFNVKVKEIIEKFMKALRDPNLPLLELQVIYPHFYQLI